MEDGALPAGAQARTQVFIVRIWYEAQADGRPAIRIQARHALTGETRYFLAWPALTAYLAGKLEIPDRSHGAWISTRAASALTKNDEEEIE